MMNGTQIEQLTVEDVQDILATNPQNVVNAEELAFAIDGNVRFSLAMILAEHHILNSEYALRLAKNNIVRCTNSADFEQVIFYGNLGARIEQQIASNDCNVFYHYEDLHNPMIEPLSSQALIEQLNSK